MSTNVDEESFGFSQFAKLNFYKEVNRKLVDSVDLSFANRIIDLACGNGQLTRQIADRLEKTRDQVVIGIDRSKQAINEAQNSVKNAGEGLIRFVQGKVENLSNILSDSADVAFLGNAIHYIDDKRKFVSNLSSNIKPDGTFAFNTSFFEGGQPDEAQTFYRRWMMQALRFLKKEYDMSPDKDKKVESRKHLSAAEYEEILQEEGFGQFNSELIPVEMPVKGWEAISGYKDFIEGALPGVPLDVGREALRKTVRETYDKLDIDSVPRHWLQVVAKKSNA